MSETSPTQRCDICGAEQPLSARTCAICGAALRGEPTPAAPLLPVAEQPSRKAPRVAYDPALGDDDLYAGELVGRMLRVVVPVALAVVLIVGLGIGFGIMRLAGDDDPDDPAVQSERLSGSPTAPPTATPRGGVAPGSVPTVTPAVTRRPTMALATVTPAPPTPTESPTPGPCMQTAQQGDTVYGMAIRCGHRDMAIVDTILEINDMDGPEQLQLGQTLEIPWPTPTPGGEPTQDPNATASTEGDSGASDTGGTPVVGGAAADVNEFGTPNALATYQNAEATLRPGMAWHVVASGETILSIATLYGAGLETLSQINPEVPFLQCDYGSPTGGPNCSVMLSIGQRIRVPVPLPTATYTPSPEGTLTPTPTATPTFNAPYLMLPEDGAHYNADQIVVLRWGGTGTLAEDERYLVRVTDQALGKEYTAVVREMMYQLPGGWQPADRNRHTFEWSIGIARIDAGMNVVSEEHITQPREFTWDSR